jgi:pSer/pThr/pTyr-binding forkhead associated (FHA) protein
LPGAHAGANKITSRNGEDGASAPADAANALSADAVSALSADADAASPADVAARADPAPAVEPPEERDEMAEEHGEKEALAGRKRERAEAQLAAKSQVITPAHTSLFKQSGEREHQESLPPRRTGSTIAHAKLVIHRGRSVGKEFPLCEDESHIGRWDADGGIFPDVDLDSDDPEAKVSRRHARITHRGEKYYVEDLGSTNGTFVNRGRRLLPGDRQPLRDGDEVIVGKTFLKFHVLKSS